MKKFYLFLFLVLALNYNASSQNVLTEDFNYAPVDSLEKSGKWYRSGLNTIYNIKVVAPGLEYKDYVGSGRGNACLISNAGEGDVLLNNFATPITSGSAYLSFMFRLDSLPSTVTIGYCICYNPNTGGTEHNTRFYIKRLSDTKFDVGVQKKGGTAIAFANKEYELHTTYLMVLKYAIIPGMDNDSSSLYVFSNGVPQNEPLNPLVSSTAGSDFTGQATVVLSNNYAQSGLKGCNIKLDGIRVGSSWQTSVLAIISAVSNVKVEHTNNVFNYPNPFTQQTKIKYQLPSNGFVRMNIFNASGVQCAQLINEEQVSGEHEIFWDAGKIPAGMYLCKIQCNEFVVNKTLIKVD